MGEKETGKRVAPGSAGGRKLALVIAAFAVGVLAVAYVGLCAFASGAKLWPHTSVLGVDVSGLTYAQAEEKLTAELPLKWVGKTVELYEPQSGTRLELDAEGLMEPSDLAESLTHVNDRGNFLTNGGRYVAALFSRGNTDFGPSLRYTEAGQKRMDDTLAELTRELGIDGNETTYEVTDEAILFEKGVTGTAVDADAVRTGVTAALIGTGPETVNISLVQAPPAEPDFEAIHREVYAEAADAYLDKDSGEIVPSVTGADFDVEAARAALDQAAEGSKCRIPLTLTEPGLSTEALTASLFRDTLGAAATKFTGTADRKKNIALACSFLNGQVVFPGDTFSFNAVCSPYSTSNGYGKAGAYVNGKTVDTTAGGICQASSTLYWSTLKANLETVERHAHRYEPNYIKGGLDATVYGDAGTSGSLDFQFKNNTDYPVKIEAYVDSDNYVRVAVYGTDATGIHGEPYSTNRVVTQYAQTTYEANPAVAQGTTQKDPERTAYNAVSIETYQQLVDASGNVISTNYLYKTNYKLRDAVIFYNPADAALWGIDPATGLKTLTPVTPTPDVADPAESTAPTESGAPVVSGDPAQTSSPAETGAVTPPVVESRPPEETAQPPVESQAPAAEPSAAPTPTPDPDAPLPPPGV